MGKRKDKRRKKSKAARLDKYELYERSVQEPEADVRLIQRVFKKRYGRRPHRVREDFCGTAIFACEWVRAHRKNLAWGVDLDAEPLAYGRERHLTRLTPDQASRVKLIEGNVLDVGHEKVDATAAFNFSYFLFKTRDELRHYFEKARATLRPEGMLFLDAYGGADSQRTGEESREVEGFDYVWDQNRFDPISHHVTNFIHFVFPNGRERRRVFRYDWRLWTLPEICELLREAGFRETEVYWEGTDEETGEGNGVFTRRDKAADDPAWIAYIVGING